MRLPKILRWRGPRWHSSKSAWSIAVGGVLMLYLVNITLRTTFFLSYYCETECNLKIWENPFLPEDRLIISYLRKNVMDPPQKQVMEPLTHRDLYHQPWEQIGYWHHVQKLIRETFVNLPNEVFVEVGAGDGVFLSHTSWLEAEMGWTGLLIEPRPSSYEALRRRRKARAAQVCVSDMAFYRMGKLWEPSNSEGVDEMYRKVADGKATLFQYVALEERELGLVNPVPCFTLNALLLAAGLGHRRRIGLLVLHTMGGESQILETLIDTEIIMLLIRDEGHVSKRTIEQSTERLNLVLYMKDVHPIVDTFLIYINKGVDIVKKKKPENSELSHKEKI